MLDNLALLVKIGWTPEAKECGRGALMALLDQVHPIGTADLRPEKLSSSSSLEAGQQQQQQQHVMLSYNWNVQDTIKRLNLALKGRRYAVWIDIEKMQGSTMEAMAGAVEDAAVMCYGISQAY